jgi:hypothetical protein
MNIGPSGQEQKRILGVQRAAPVRTARHTVEQQIKRGNLTAKKAGHTWVVDDAGAKRRAAQFRPHEGAVEAGQTSKPGRQ